MDTIPDYVSGCLQLALLLEVSAYPKPGNVHRTADFQKTRYEHFLASTVAVAPHFRRAAENGVAVYAKGIGLGEVGVGKMIKDAVTDVAAWQHGGNTLLGSIILLMPMAVAAGATLAENSLFRLNKFRRTLRSVVESSSPTDAVNLYDAINVAQPGGLGKTSTLDVTDAASKQRILEEQITLFEVFKTSASWDSISSEWVSGYCITFDIGYAYLERQLEGKVDVNVATVHTFLKVLSEVPDSLIARKAGLEEAKKVSAQARQVLESGGMTTQKGLTNLLRMDRRLHDPAHKLNPGTTADLTAAALAVAMLRGYRP